MIPSYHTNNSNNLGLRPYSKPSIYGSDLTHTLCFLSRVLKGEDKLQMTSQSGHGFLSIFFGGKYDLIHLSTQTNYTSKCLEFLFHHKNNITTSTFDLKSKENNENDMTSVVWAGTVFGSRLWPL